MTTTSNLRVLRNSRKKLREEFELRKRQEWRELVAETDARIQLEVNRLHREGWTVSAIMREYGTSDRKTVNDLIFTTMPVPTGASGPLTWTHVQGDTYSVTDGTNTAEFVVLKDEQDLVLVSTTDYEFGESVTFAQFVEN